MNSIEQKELTDKINSLVGSSNSWDNIVKFFEENKDIQPYLQDTREECWKDQCFSYSTIMILTIKRLLEEIETLKDDIQFIKGEEIIKFPKGKTINIKSKLVRCEKINKVIE